MNRYDVIVIGAGVIGCSVACHLAELGAGRVQVLDRTQVGAGTTSQSSGILRTHYSVIENAELALASWRVFTNFAACLGDPEASAGLLRCGYLSATPVVAERHSVLALEVPAAYTFAMPVYKALGSEGMLYCRSYGSRQMLVSEGIAGETLPAPDNEQGDISMDTVMSVGTQVARRFPGFETAGVASRWTGFYDVTPDWNPVLGRLPDVPGLVVGYGFSGHGLKLSPAVDRILAQEAVGLPTDVSLAPYALERFRTGKLLTGKYGHGAVS